MSKNNESDEWAKPPIRNRDTMTHCCADVNLRALCAFHIPGNNLTTGQSTERVTPQHKTYKPSYCHNHPSPTWSRQWPGDSVLNEFTFPGTFRSIYLAKQFKEKKKSETHMKPLALSHKSPGCIFSSCQARGEARRSYHRMDMDTPEDQIPKASPL